MKISKAPGYYSLAAFLLLVGGASAAEDQKSIYLFGVRASMAGFTPPPGFYASSFTYLYKGDTANAAMSVKANAVLDVVSLLWVSPDKLMGGTFGLGFYAPFGRQNVAVGINPPPGGARVRVSDNTFSVGDPLALAFIGWQAGNFHWKLTAMANVPLGRHSRRELANIGFNRWAADLTGSVTWIDPASKLEISVSPGVMFHGENPDSRYRTGTEFHIEASVMHHVSQAFSFGLAGYHLRQLSGDRGAGAVFGPFKGEVSAIGPNLAYNFSVGGRPVYASLRWLHEFAAKNRLKGDAAFLTFTVPLAGMTAR